MGRIFVTGGTGFIGMHVVKRLISEGNTVRVMARSLQSGRAASRAGAEAVKGDLFDRACLERGMAGCTGIVHAAGIRSASSARAIFAVNVQGTQNVIDAARAAGVRRLVHISSDAVVLTGRPFDGADETLPLQIGSRLPYVATKARAEKLIMDAARPELETVSLRPKMVWNHAGDGGVAAMLKAGHMDGSFRWTGDGHHITDVTHVDNVAQAVCLALNSRVSRRAFFITDGQAVDFRDFFSRILSRSGVIPSQQTQSLGKARLAAMWGDLRHKAHMPASTDSFLFWVSHLNLTFTVERARRELGYVPVLYDI
ncbi:NAD-dependent epimerase/dehydratase family protein [Streptomyces chartreusis]|uniref:NAD-dependent epimerase/dehydratase family protein n=1 Tax=Streptomyces chartreusis TaxID=1969 RepID=UPI003401EC67